MQTEELKKFIISLLKDQFDSIIRRLQTLEDGLQQLKNKLVAQESNHQQQENILQNSIKQLESKFQSLETNIEQAKQGAKLSLEKTENKLKEIEKIKQNQTIFQNNQQRRIQEQQQLSHSFSQPTYLQQQEHHQQYSPQQKTNPPPQQAPQMQTSQSPSCVPSQYSQNSIQQNNSDMVYRTTNGKKYHKVGCEWLKNSQIPIKRQEAEIKGITACFVCKP